MVVAIEAILSKVRDVDVGPTVVVKIADDGADAPAIICNSGFCCDVGERTIMVVTKQRSVRRSGLSCQRVVCRAVHEIDIQPAVVVVVQQSDTRADRVNDVGLLRRPHHVLPLSQARSGSDVFEDHWSGTDKSAGSYGAMLSIENSGTRRAGGDAAVRGWLGSFNWLLCSLLKRRGILCTQWSAHHAGERQKQVQISSKTASDDQAMIHCSEYLPRKRFDIEAVRSEHLLRHQLPGFGFGAFFL